MQPTEQEQEVAKPIKPALAASPVTVAAAQGKDVAAPAPATHANFPIVGIGASAGGLAAFEAFF